MPAWRSRSSYGSRWAKSPCEATPGGLRRPARSYYICRLTRIRKHAAYQECQKSPASGREAPRTEPLREEGAEGADQKVSRRTEGRHGRAKAGRVCRLFQEARQGGRATGDSSERGS